MTYLSEVQSLSRVPVWYVALKLDVCSLTFGTSPCTASGTKCYNTFPTCKDKTNYDRDYRIYEFTSEAVPGVFDNVFPFVVDVTTNPTEIKDNLTVRARVQITLRELEESDVITDPYFPSRGIADPVLSPGTFWRRFWARNRNYKGRIVWIYEGFDSLAKADYEKRFQGVIENVTVDGDKCIIEIVDQLQDLSNKQIPVKTNATLQSDVPADLLVLPLSATTEYDASGYVIVDDEIINFTSKTSGGLVIPAGGRGKFGTTAAEHDADTRVQQCRYFAPDHPVAHLLDMLQTDAGVASGDIDTDAFTDAEALLDTAPDVSNIITEPTKISEIYFNLVDLIDAKCWVNEDNKITMAFNLPNQPGRTYATITDDANIVAGSASVDLNEESRFTRVNIYWDQDFNGDEEKPETYRALDISIDATAEDEEYLDSIEKTMYGRWFSRYLGDAALYHLFVRNTSARWLAFHRDAQTLLNVDVELKDSTINTGDMALVTTNELQNTDGTDLTEWPFQVVRRVRNGSNKFSLTLAKMPDTKYFIIAPNTGNDYDDATQAEKEYGFISSNDGNPEEPNYVIW